MRGERATLAGWLAGWMWMVVWRDSVEEQVSLNLAATRDSSTKRTGTVDSVRPKHFMLGWLPLLVYPILASG